MSDNEVLALKIRYGKWREKRMKGLQKVDPFEFFCADQFLKPYRMTDAEIIWGLVDDHRDGGVDAFHFILNGVSVDDNAIVDSRTRGEINLVIMQVKEEKGFSPIDVGKLFFFTDDLLNIGRPPNEYHTAYHERLLNLMRIFKDKYIQMSEETPQLIIDYYFVTGNDAEPVRDAVVAGERVCAKAKEWFKNADVRPFHFINATRLYAQTEIRPLKKKGLTFSQWFDSPEGWAGLVSLQNYFDFLKDESGEKLNDDFLDENVRGY
jgi:hypothetical protein